MSEPLKILIIEDQQDDFLLVERHLKQHGLSACCRRMDSLDGLKAAIDRESWDLVLADYSVPQFSFEEGMSLIAESDLDVPVIMVTGTVGEEKAVEILKLGVLDFVLKDNLARLVPAIVRCLGDAADRRVKSAAVEALRQSEEMYRSLFSNMLNGFAHCRMIFDGETPRDFVYLNVNDAFEKQTGLNNVVGRKVSEVIPGIRETDPELFRIYGRVALTGEPERFETWVESLGIWFAIAVYSPEKEHIVAVFDNISERKKAEQALADSEERLNLALRGANDGLWDWKLKTGELYYSPRWKSMLGYADDELENCYANWERLLHPDDVEPARTKLRDFQAGRTLRYEIEFRMRHKEGHYVDILSRGFLLHDDQGEALRMVGTHVDVTERKKLEEQFRQAQKMEAVGQLAGGVAHDFNNMLGVILGYAELGLTHLAPGDPLYQNLQQIRNAAERSAVLTRQLLTFARKQDSVPAIIDLNEVVAEQLKMLERLIGEDVRVEFHPDPDLGRTRVDPAQIGQILTNLAVNARDAIAGTGVVSIATANVTLDEFDAYFNAEQAPGEYVHLSFSDTGTGMDAETRERIFEPFFTTKELGKGTGLGLSTVFGIVKQNGGSINVYSEPGMGTTFKLYLPRFAGEVAMPRQEAPQAVRSAGSETVLLVEDDEQILDLVRSMLAADGYQVLAASSPQAACTLCAQHQGNIDLLITDVIMPTMNGKELQERIAGIKPDIRTLFMSGYTADIIAERGVIAQGVNFISKPFSLQALSQKVREVLGDAGV